jgi:hypothetical protein
VEALEQLDLLLLVATGHQEQELLRNAVERRPLLLLLQRPLGRRLPRCPQLLRVCRRQLPQPTMRFLSRSEKFRLARLLLDELAGEDLLSRIKQEGVPELPEFAPGGAAQLAALLAEQGKRP